jgi:decaprenylphospho-beta-D-ribofuranose 2-oxidase
VAWLDGHRGGAGTGAGVVSTAGFADVADLPLRYRRDPLRYPHRRRLPVPSLPGSGVVRPPAVAIANRAHLSAARLRRGARLKPLAAVLHPLDALRGWPGLYGRSGLVQYQFVVPIGAEQTLVDALVSTRAAGTPAALAVLKLLGAADPAALSFPQPGWTLALDFPAATAGLGTVLDVLDDRVAAAGGRVYLVKDSRLRPDLVSAMYPALPRWRAVRNRLDPAGVLASDLDRRLDLTGRRAAGKLGRTG